VQFVNLQRQPLMLGERAVEIPALFFKVVSAKHHLIIVNKVAIPEGINENAVTYRVSQMLLLPTVANIYQLQHVGVKDVNGQLVEDFVKDLHLCCAADSLGVSSFTQALFNKFSIRVITAVPRVTALNLLTTLNNPTANKLFGRMANTIATKIYEETFIDREDFKVYYLPTNARLSKAVYDTIAKLEIASQKQANEKAYFKERQAGRGRQAAVATVAAVAEANEARLKEAGESFRQKFREGKKNFAQLEVLYAWKVVGKRVATKPGV